MFHFIYGRLKGNLYGSLYFDTPGSKINRNFHLEGSLEKLKNLLTLSVGAPTFGNYSIRANMTLDDDKKGLSFFVHHNEDEMVNINIGLLMSSSQRSGW